MTKSKTAHMADEGEALVIAEAVAWTAFQFRGVGGRCKAEAATRAEAEVAARQMLDERADRPVMIYAINAAGRQALADTIRA